MKVFTLHRMTPLFNRKLHQLRRTRAAHAYVPDEGVDFLLREVAMRTADRLLDIQRHFPLALELGCYHGAGGAALKQSGRIDHLIQADISAAMVQHAPSALRVVADEEWLPIAANSLDAIISLMSLQWVNDLPGCLIQCQQALKDDGLFLAVIPGARSLWELRQSILAVSAERGSLSPRLSPLVEIRDAGALLQRAGFALPVAESETLTLRYKEPGKLLRELQQMAQSNCLIEQHKGLTSPHFWAQVMVHYQQHFALPDGRLPLTVELITLTGWKPHHSQQQPAKRGSGTVSLSSVLKP